MPIVDSVVVVGFKQNDQAYEGLSVLKSLTDQQQLTARSAAVVERDQTGKLQIKDSLTPKVAGRPLVAGWSG
jgi:uncharacterized membrane protein